MTKGAKKSWVVIFQPRDAEQFDYTSMKVIDCWTAAGGYVPAYAEMSSRAKRYFDEHGDGKVSLFEGDLQANFLWPHGEGK